VVDYDWYIPALALTLWLLMGLSLSGAASRRIGPRTPRHGDAPPSTSLPPWRRLVSRIGLGAVVIVVCFFPMRVIAAANSLQRARAALARGDVHAAHHHLYVPIAITRGNAAAYSEMATVLVAMAPRGDPGALWVAIGMLEDASALQPTEATHWFQRARLYRQVGQPEQAIAAAERAAYLSPCDTRVLLQLARMYEGAGRLDDAHEVYVRIDELWHSPVGRHQAIEEYVNLDYAYAWLHLAQLAAADGDTEELHALKQRALTLLDDYRLWAAIQADMAAHGVKIRPPDTASAESLRSAFEALDPT